MSQVGIWNGVDPGAGRVESADRTAQTANYNALAQIENFKKTFGVSARGPSLSL